MSEHIRADRHGDWGIITLDRPKALNSLTLDMCIAMDDQLEAWASDDDVKAVLVEGEGEKAFCAGGDIRWLTETGKQDAEEAAGFFRKEYRLDTRIHHFPKPYVVLMDGITMGGGVGISSGASHRIATDRTLWAMPECGIGLIPDVGASYFLPRLNGGLGNWLALTGERLRGADCVSTQIATHFIPSEKLGELRETLTRLSLGDNAETLISKCLATRDEAKPGPIVEALAEIDHYFARVDSLGSLMDDLRKESGGFGQRCLTAMEAASPTSLSLTHRLLSDAPAAFNDCISREFCVAAHLMASHDFHEGVRAQVIDKDREPKWQPATLSEVAEAEIERYFATPVGGPLDLSGTSP